MQRRPRVPLDNLLNLLQRDAMTAESRPTKKNVEEEISIEFRALEEDEENLKCTNKRGIAEV